MVSRPPEGLAHRESRLSHNVYDNKSSYGKFDETRLFRKRLNPQELSKPGAKKGSHGGIEYAGKSQNVDENTWRKNVA